MEAKAALDRVIRKSRVHFYKPIQVAELLFYDRTRERLDFRDLESYRNVSKRWRDRVSLRVIGRVSTSSQKFQDNLFDENALPPHTLASLASHNRQGGGMVEAYIYRCLESKLLSLQAIIDYIESVEAGRFSLHDFAALLARTPGLKRSIDKMYEIAVYALFATLVRTLRVQVTLTVQNRSREILADFAEFLSAVLGIDQRRTSHSFPAALYRVGVTNAADRGLDMWGNFGPAVQVKHLTLTPMLLEEITEQLTADRIVVVCRDAERAAIDALLMQVGWADRIQGILTFSDLDRWYRLCLSPKYAERLARRLLADLRREFEAEFPSGRELAPFLKERGYDRLALPKSWQVAR